MDSFFKKTSQTLENTKAAVNGKMCKGSFTGLFFLFCSETG